MMQLTVSGKHHLAGRPMHFFRPLAMTGLQLKSTAPDMLTPNYTTSWSQIPVVK